VCEQAKFDQRIKNRKRQATADEKEAKKIKNNELFVENRALAKNYFKEFVRLVPDCADCKESRVGTLEAGAQGICEGYTCVLGADAGKQPG
jgi:hypothetical protein